MDIRFRFYENEPYLVAKILDTIVTKDRASAIFQNIGQACEKYKCQKVLLNELTVEKREIKNYEIMKLSDEFPSIYLAFLCKPELIDKKAAMLTYFSFTNKYVIKHFSEEEPALKWLLSHTDA